MNRTIATLAAACFALSAATAFAQAPAGDTGGERHQRMMKRCSQEADPAKCEAMRKQMRENMKQARESCRSSPDRHACMANAMCAKSPDPAKCQAHSKERLDRRQKAAEACTGKRGDELRQCIREQQEKSGRPLRKG